MFEKAVWRSMIVATLVGLAACEDDPGPPAPVYPSLMARPEHREVVLSRLDREPWASIHAAVQAQADRAYEDDGSLVSRSREGSVLHDEDLCVRRVLQLVREGKVETISGKTISVRADTICLHGDNQKALVFARLLAQTLRDNGVEIRPFAPSALR